MGAIKDVIDLLTDLSKRTKDRKIAAELQPIQQLVLELQSEHALLHEDNIKLREENLGLKEKIRALTDSVTETPDGVPSCPNCSTSQKPFYMAPIPLDFVPIENVTHECSQCHYKSNAESC